MAKASVKQGIVVERDGRRAQVSAPPKSPWSPDGEGVPVGVVPVGDDAEAPSVRYLPVPVGRRFSRSRASRIAARVPGLAALRRTAPKMAGAAVRIGSRLPQWRGARADSALEEAWPPAGVPERDERIDMPRKERELSRTSTARPKKLRKQLRKAEKRLAKAQTRRDRAQARVEALNIIADELRAQLADAEKAEAAGTSAAASSATKSTTTKRRATSKAAGASRDGRSRTKVNGATPRSTKRKSLSGTGAATTKAGSAADAEAAKAASPAA